MTTTETRQVDDRVGAARPHREGIPKVAGEFEFASDLHRDGALFGATLRALTPRRGFVRSTWPRRCGSRGSAVR